MSKIPGPQLPMADAAWYAAPAIERHHGFDSPNSKGEGALELFIRDFNSFEASSGLFARCRDEEGFAWWDLVRYSLQYQLCAEKGICAHQQTTRNSLLARAYSLGAQSTLLVKDALKLVSLRGEAIRRVYVFGRRFPYLLDDIERSIDRCLVIGDGNAPVGRHFAIGKGSIDFFVRVASKFVHAPAAVIAEAERLQEEIRTRFDSRIDVRQLVQRKYVQHKASWLAWSLILARAPNLHLVGFVGDDTLKTLIYLANKRGIRTREFQHGYMGRSHINYSYPALAAPVTTLPAEVVVWRDSGDISYPVPTLTVKAPGASTGAKTAQHVKDINVLIGGSPTRASEALSIIRALVGKNLSLAVKLHPAQSESSSGLRKYFSTEQVRIYSNDVDFESLARRAHVYVPANPTSTTTFEAVENGAKLIVVDYGGVKMTSMVDGIVSGRVSTFEDLYEAVRLHLQPTASDPRSTDSSP